MGGVWEQCQSEVATVELTGEVVRVVESQEQVATNALVDDLAEQSILGSLLERSKPPLTAPQGLHYLLFTPFRYPPLPHGSRFGGRYEPSLFYASRELPTALAESAFYRFYFWQGMAIPPAVPLITQHTAFTAAIAVKTGVRLQQPPFAAFESELVSASRYQPCQQLGAAMRQNGVEGFEYLSARDQSRGINVALFTPTVFAYHRPTSNVSLICSTQASRVEFMDESRVVYHYSVELFGEEGRVQLPEGA